MTKALSASLWWISESTMEMAWRPGYLVSIPRQWKSFHYQPRDSRKIINFFPTNVDKIRCPGHIIVSPFATLICHHTSDLTFETQFRLQCYAITFTGICAPGCLGTRHLTLQCNRCTQSLHVSIPHWSWFQGPYSRINLIRCNVRYPNFYTNCLMHECSGLTQTHLFVWHVHKMSPSLTNNILF